MNSKWNMSVVNKNDTRKTSLLRSGAFIADFNTLDFNLQN